MKAMLLNAFGESFQSAEIDTPTPGPGQVLIKVEASSVNPIDTKIRAGLVAPVSPELPGVLHGDVAGTVAALGEGVTDFQVGDRVYGVAGGFKGHDGATAEYMRANAAALAPIPERLSFAEAAALPLVGCTAWVSLFEKGELQAGQRVLIQGGTGGVGHVAIQLARAAGAHVTATVSNEERAALAKRLGAHETLNYNDDIPANNWELVFDTPGGNSLNRSFEACARRGTVVGIAGRSDHNLGLLHTKELSLKFCFLIGFFIDPSRDQADLGRMLRKMNQLIETDQLSPMVAQSFPFSQVNEAHAALEAGGFTGKIVLTSDL